MKKFFIVIAVSLLALLVFGSWFNGIVGFLAFCTVFAAGVFWHTTVAVFNYFWHTGLSLAIYGPVQNALIRYGVIGVVGVFVATIPFWIVALSFGWGLLWKGDSTWNAKTIAALPASLKP